MMDASAAVSVILGSSQLGTPPKRSGTPVDVPNGWDPRTNKQPTGLFVALPAAVPCFSSPTGHPTKEKIRRCKATADFWWGAQWDSNPRSPDPQSGALTDYAMGTTSMRPKGLEPPAHCLEGSCSIHLSYGRTLLSHWVPLWRQSCVGTRCEKYNTIRNPVCQEQFEKSFGFLCGAVTAATCRQSRRQTRGQARRPHPGYGARR